MSTVNSQEVAGVAPAYHWGSIRGHHTLTPQVTEDETEAKAKVNAYPFYLFSPTVGTSVITINYRKNEQIKREGSGKQKGKVLLWNVYGWQDKANMCW